MEEEHKHDAVVVDCLIMSLQLAFVWWQNKMSLPPPQKKKYFCHLMEEEHKHDAVVVDCLIMSTACICVVTE